jgi:hypothetical protein
MLRSIVLYFLPGSFSNRNAYSYHSIDLVILCRYHFVQRSNYHATIKKTRNFAQSIESCSKYLVLLRFPQETPELLLPVFFKSSPPEVFKTNTGTRRNLAVDERGRSRLVLADFAIDLTIAGGFFILILFV